MSVIFDSSPHSRDGVYVDCRRADGITPGRLSADFRVASRYGYVPNPGRVLAPEAPYTVECWTRLDEVTTGYQCPMACREDFVNSSDRTRGFNFYKVATVGSNEPSIERGKWSFWVGRGVNTYNGSEWARLYGGTPQADVWTYLVGAVTAGGASFYIDGTLIMSQAFTPYRITSEVPVGLGVMSHGVPGAAGGGGLSVIGDVAEAAIIPSALSAARVAERFSLRDDPAAYRSHVLADSPLGYWRLDDPCEGWRIGSMGFGGN